MPEVHEAHSRVFRAVCHAGVSIGENLKPLRRNLNTTSLAKFHQILLVVGAVDKILLQVEYRKLILFPLIGGWLNHLNTISHLDIRDSFLERRLNG